MFTPQDITKDIDKLVQEHGNDDIWSLRDNDLAMTLAGSFSDAFKDANGFRPRFSISVNDVLADLKRFSEEAKAEFEKDSQPLNGIFFEGQPVKPIDWDDPDKYWYHPEYEAA
jgi:hypothetical protein